MPWLFKFQNSKVWWVGYRLHGQQFLRSTGHRERTDAEKELQRINTMIVAQKANLLTLGVFEELTGKTIPRITLRDALADWLNEVRGAAGQRTVEKYESVAKALEEFFRSNDRGPMLSEITSVELSRMLGEKRASVTASTTNLLRTCLAIFFKRSKLRGYIRENPVEAIRAYKAGTEEKRKRRPFTQAELVTLYQVAPDNFWKYAVLGGFTTGLRLGDLVTMPIGAVDWKARCLRLNVRKTGKKIYIPLAPEFFKMLKTMAASRPDAAPTEAFWPEHAARYETTGAKWFSQRFYDLVLVKAGLASVRPHRQGTKQKSDKRAVNDVSFHCLRHSCVSTHAANMQNQQLVMALAGHSSDEVNDLYTTLPPTVLAKAVAQLPDITK